VATTSVPRVPPCFVRTAQDETTALTKQRLCLPPPPPLTFAFVLIRFGLEVLRPLETGAGDACALAQVSAEVRVQGCANDVHVAPGGPTQRDCIKNDPWRSVGKHLNRADYCTLLPRTRTACAHMSLFQNPDLQLLQVELQERCGFTRPSLYAAADPLSWPQKQPRSAILEAIR